MTKIISFMNTDNFTVLLRGLTFLLTLLIAIVAFFIKRDLDKLDALYSIPDRVKNLEIIVQDLNNKIYNLKFSEFK